MSDEDQPQGAVSSVAVVVDGVLWENCNPQTEPLFKCQGDVHVFQAEDYLILQNERSHTYWWDGETITGSPGLFAGELVPDPEVPIREPEFEPAVADLVECPSEVGKESQLDVKITVIDDSNEQPIADALVTVRHNDNRAYYGLTDSLGEYNFSPRPRAYQVEATAIGYIPVSDIPLIANYDDLTETPVMWSDCLPPYATFVGEDSLIIRLKRLESSSSSSGSTSGMSGSGSSSSSSSSSSSASSGSGSSSSSSSASSSGGGGGSSSSGGGGGSSSSSSSSGACPCLTDPLFDYGNDSYTIARRWRTESTESGDLFKSVPDQTFDGWDWSSSYVPGPSTGSFEFTVCEATSIDFDVTTDIGATSAEVRYYLNGNLVHTESSLGSGGSYPYVLDIAGSVYVLPCENVVRVEVDYGSGFQGGIIGISDVYD